MAKEFTDVDGTSNTLLVLTSEFFSITGTVTGLNQLQVNSSEEGVNKSIKLSFENGQVVFIKFSQKEVQMRFGETGEFANPFVAEDFNRHLADLNRHLPWIYRIGQTDKFSKLTISLEIEVGGYTYKITLDRSNHTRKIILSVLSDDRNSPPFSATIS